MTDPTKPDARVIPGLGALGAPPGSKASKRSRPKSSAQPKQQPQQSNLDAGAGGAGAASSNLKESHKPAHLALNPDALLVPQLDSAADIPPRVPASVIVAKRVKALQKKLQRIQGYADVKDQASLNEDQKRAVQSKPSLEATIKELQDVVKLLEQDETEQDKHSATRAAQEEKRVQSRIGLATHETTKQAQSDLTLLLQFFHLNSLFNPDPSFNPPALPAVVTNATGQEAAAVRTLAEAFINGPLMGGGGDDAFERLAKLAKAEHVDVIEGVSYGRVKQMILDLTAAPAEVSAEHAEADELPKEPAQVNGHAPELQQEQVQAAADEARSNILQQPSSGLNFMQASELEPPQPQQQQPDPSPWNPEPVAAQQPAAGPWNETPAAPAPASAQGQGEAPTQEAVQRLGGATNPESWGPAAAATGGPTTEAVSSWADDVEQATQPAQPPATTVAPVAEQSKADQQQPQQQQQQSSRGGRGNNNRRGRGQGGGGRGRRGGQKDNSQQQQQQDDGSWTQVTSNNHQDSRGGNQGGRGRGRGGAGGRGRGRGGPRPQQAQQQSQAAQ